MKSDRLTSETIQWLRFPMAGLVVLLHGAQGGMYSPLLNYHILSLLTYGGICRIAVPCFFLVSGYLFFRDLRDWDLTTWKGKMIRRVQTLFLPYILWNLIAAVVLLSYAYFRVMIGSLDYESFLEERTGILGNPFSLFWDFNHSGMPIDYPLWFVRDLILFTLCTPLIYVFCRYLGGWGIAALGLLLFVLIDVPEGIWFYSCGAWFSISGRDLTESLCRFKWPALSIVILFLCSLPWLSQKNEGIVSYLQELFIIAGCICAISFTSLGIRQGPLLSLVS